GLHLEDHARVSRAVAGPGRGRAGRSRRAGIAAAAGRRRELKRQRDYDEEDVRVRPRPTSRPRTRTRPRHEDAAEGFVVAVDRGRYTCAVGERLVTAMRARELGRRGVVVGDRVAIVGDTSGEEGALARIIRIDERSS